MTTDKDPIREAFEAWAETRYPYRKPVLQRNGEYETYWQSAWVAWQASRKQALSEAAQVCQRLYVEYNANQYTAPMSAALAECEEEIRSLK